MFVRLVFVVSLASGFAPGTRLARPPASRRAVAAAPPRMAVSAAAAAANPVVQAFEVPRLVRGVSSACAWLARRSTSPASRAGAARLLREIVEPLDLATIGACVWLSRRDRLLRALPRRERDFADSLAGALAPAARLLAGLVWPAFYALDVACTLLRAAGAITPQQSAQAVQVALALGYAAATGRAASSVKAWALRRAAGAQAGRAAALDRVGDVAVWAFVGAGALEKLSLELGFALKSALAFGGVGSVVLGLACQTPLANVVSSRSLVAFAALCTSLPPGYEAEEVLSNSSLALRALRAGERRARRVHRPVHRRRRGRPRRRVRALRPGPRSSGT